ncbi:hypothetical protein ACL9RJ_16705 [Pseudomonas sp. Mn2068]|uniref:hypothetical protein n=1 Tax=Pseudomonas sp. Mn2068 TaxID=3395265 RepID=UPI003BD551E3
MLIDEYQLLAVDDYHLQFTEVEVYGITSSREIVYRGTGAINRGRDSRLTIMVLTSPNLSFEEERAEVARKLREGQALSEQLTCRMKAKDQLGRWWNECEIFITKITNDESKTTIIAEVDKFVLKVPNGRGDELGESRVEIVTVHNGDLPFQIKQKEGEGFEWDLNFMVSDFSIRITKDMPCTKIALHHESAIDRSRVKILLEAISICSGRVITPLLMSWQDKEHSNLEVFHGEADHNRLPSILDELSIFKIETIKLFVECYLSAFSVPYEETYAAWHRAYLASGSSMEISSLALCTAIEGIVKYRFTEATPISVEVDDELVKVSEIVNKIESTEWIVESILKHLERIRESKPTIGKSLKHFASSHNISSKQIQRWESLRNKITHFDLLDDSPEENEKLLRDYKICLTIFFKLVARSAGYNWVD